ncbi:MAG TPA: transcription termination/antitermination NusG family protein, partial [Saprospiraceae bacterium]|nr:transcription termination/antitermination NusG family protein [Saprospiraceae bacterium]
KERKIKEQLDKEISRNGWGAVVKQVFLPMEKVYKVQNGKKVMSEKVIPVKFTIRKPKLMVAPPDEDDPNQDTNNK